MKISLVAAVAQNRVIGKNNDLPWHLPDDMKFFMQTTRNHYVVLGRKNYESLPDKYKPLPNRTNVIVTRQKDFHAPGCLIAHGFKEAINIAEANNETEFMVIGGADIYALALPFADRLYLTEVNAFVDGDVYFPDFDKSEWHEVSRVHHPRDEKHEFSFDFVLYEKKKP